MRAVKWICVLSFLFLATTACKKRGTARIKSENSVKVCTLPADNTSGLPLPSTIANKDFQPLLYQFLGTRKYQMLKWAKDQTIRDTGPMVGSTYLGTHPAVRIYYSPAVVHWMEGDRKGCVPDGSMIIKEMYESPASKHKEVTADQPATLWTVMIKDQKGARDGWYWSYYDLKPGGGSQPQPVDSPDYPFHYGESGFGSYCVRCHGSSQKELTFSALHHLEGEKYNPLPYHEYLSLVKTAQGLGLVEDDSSPKLPPHHTDSPTPDSALSLSGGAATTVPKIPNQAFMSAFSNYPALRLPETEVAKLKLPGMTHDHVPAAQVAQEFATSDQCMGCHDADRSPFGVTTKTPLGNMVSAEAASQTRIDLNGKSVGLKNTSPYGEWRWSMMGLAGRDPIFFAQLDTETQRFKAAGEVVVDTTTQKPTTLNSSAIQDTCLSCHGAMGQRQMKFDREKNLPGVSPLMSLDMLKLTSDGGHPHSKYASLARDGISCMVCHQMENNNGQKLVDIATGKFEIKRPEGNENKIYGPREDVAAHMMQESLGMKPEKNEFISSSRMCASCHTVYLPVLNRQGEVKKWGYEQTTYMEWQNSKYADGKPEARSCQSCHMPKSFEGKTNAGKIANVEDQDFPDYVVGQKHRDHFDGIFAPLKEATVKHREDGVSRHSLNGINLFALEMFNQFDELLGVRKPSYMSGINDGVESALRNNNSTAKSDTAAVEIVGSQRSGNSVRVRVKVTNKTGHRFPSGVGFRRAFLEVTATDSSGNVKWASGTTNSVGEILDGQSKQPLASERSTERDGKPLYQPHFQTISRQDQAQIYEELVTDDEGKLTTSFLSIFGHLKDSRLLPKGFSQSGAPSFDEEQVKAVQPHLVMAPGQTDSDFGSDGADEVDYEITLPAGTGAVNVKATLDYQSIPPRYLRDRFASAQGEPTQRLYYLTSRLKTDGTAIENWRLPLASATLGL